MDLEKAKRGLKRFGFIWVAFGILLAVLGIVLLVGSKVAAADAARAVNAPMFFHAGLTNLIVGIVGIDAGCYCFKSVKDSSKAKTVRNIAIIGLGFAVISIISGFVRGTLSPNGIATSLASMAVNGLLLYEAIIVMKGSDKDKS